MLSQGRPSGLILKALACEQPMASQNDETTVRVGDKERQRENIRLDMIERRLRGLEAEVLSISGRLTERLRQEAKNAGQEAS